MATIKLTPTSYIVLGLLDFFHEASPYDLKQMVARTVGNFWSVPHSQLYREIERLEKAGHVKGEEERTAGGRSRTVYSLTPLGTRVLQAWRADTTEELPELRDPGLLKLFFGADPGPLAETRRTAHKRKLDEYLERSKIDPGGTPRGPWQALQAGIAHERVWVRFWSKLAGD